jgi:predicted nucleic acid-binding protein
VRLRRADAPHGSGGEIRHSDDWLEASEVITAIGSREPAWRSKLPALLNDVLIALTARQIGATVITANHGDFRLIRRHKHFLLRLVDE